MMFISKKMTDQSGYSMLELLGVIMLCSLLIPISMGILQEAFSRLHPLGEYSRQANSVSQANTMLLMLQRDIDRAQQCMSSHDTYSVKSDDVILKLADRVIIWHVMGNRIQRLERSQESESVQQYASGINHWQTVLTNQELIIDFSVQANTRRKTLTTFHTVFLVPSNIRSTQPIHLCNQVHL